MGESKLTSEKTFEAERKFWKICDYVSSLLLPEEQLDNWYIGLTGPNGSINGISDKFMKHKNEFPEMDIITWKVFAIPDEEIGLEVERMLRVHGFDSDKKEPCGELDVIYVFRKERKSKRQFS